MAAELQGIEARVPLRTPVGFELPYHLLHDLWRGHAVAHQVRAGVEISLESPGVGPDSDDLSRIAGGRDEIRRGHAQLLRHVPGNVGRGEALGDDEPAKRLSTGADHSEHL